MTTQAKTILNALEEKSWTLVSSENPKSEGYWWVWEFWTLQKNEVEIVLSFLIDPMESKKKQEAVWAVAMTKEEPEERLEAEKGVLFVLGRNWENGLLSFVAHVDKLT